MANKKPDFIFECKKCGHLLYVPKVIDKLIKLLKTDCNECGEEPCWIICGEGDFDKIK